MTISIDATPQKRLFLSIIADYDLKTAICELVDNSLDHWLDRGRQAELHIDVSLNVDRQSIVVRDNAGGVSREELQLLVAPGASREKIQTGLIGNFGVGGKRAGIALGERVEIQTRNGLAESLEFEITDKWLRRDDWFVDVHPCEELPESSTTVRITQLRQGFDQTHTSDLLRHLAETYANFIGNQCRIRLNGIELDAVKFNNWAYPKEYGPVKGEFSFSPDENDSVFVRITGGLILDRDPEEENYGVYFYFNERLILAHEKTHHVGFLRGHAGVPHPDASLCRVIVEISGLPSLMPWTSSKSGINWSHPVFLEIRERVFSMATRYSKISRRLKDDRENSVFAHTDGAISSMDLKGGGSVKRIVELPVPRGRAKKYSDRILEENEAIFRKQPWTRGLVEAFGFADIAFRRRASTKNRIALIILDSTLEISLKEYLVHQEKEYYSDAKIAELFKSRDKVLKEIEKHAPQTKSDLEMSRHYANLRNKLIHERATVDILDQDVEVYREAIKRVLIELHGVELT